MRRLPQAVWLRAFNLSMQLLLVATLYPIAQTAGGLNRQSTRHLTALTNPLNKPPHARCVDTAR